MNVSIMRFIINILQKGIQIEWTVAYSKAQTYDIEIHFELINTYLSTKSEELCHFAEGSTNSLKFQVRNSTCCNQKLKYPTDY